MARIYCFGDSITFGESDWQAGGWVDRLKQHYLNLPVTDALQKTLVYNLGVASETTDGLEKRFESELSSRVTSKTGNIIFLSYGTNDVTKIVDRLGKTKNRVPLDYYIGKLKHCVKYAQMKNAVVIVTTILPIASKYNGMENPYHETRTLSDIELYNRAIYSMSHELGCSVLDLFSEFSSSDLNLLLAKDGLHPNEKGHQIIFNKVKDLLDALVG